MGHDFTNDERYQSDHSGSPVIDAKDKRITELEAGIKALINDMANARVAGRPINDVDFAKHDAALRALVNM